MNRVELKPYEDAYEADMLADITAFWETHHNVITLEQAKGDLKAWTEAGHELYTILSDGEVAGFLHMGNRGGGCNWLEDVFVREGFRGQGVGSAAIETAWMRLREEDQETMYLEVVPANEGAIKLYHRLGFTNLNTLTLNRSVKEKRQLGTQDIGGLEFKTYRPNDG